MKQFWIENKVFVLGLIGAILIVLQQFTDIDRLSYKALAFAVILAGLSYVAKEWRGQTTSMIGIICTVLTTIITTYQSGESISYLQIIIQVLGLFLATQSPDAKSRGYEHSDIVMEAKKEGELLNPALLTKK